MNYETRVIPDGALVLIATTAMVGIILFLNWLMGACFINGFHWRTIHFETWQLHLSLFLLLNFTVNLGIMLLVGYVYGKVAKARHNS